MKKLLAIILILALLLPAAAGALVRDRIVGYWYIFIDGDHYPEFMANYGDYNYVLSAYFFSSDGFIMLLENDMKDNAATPTFITCGKWEKEKMGIDTYHYQIMGMGEGTIKIEDNGNMYMAIPNNPTNLSLHLRMIFPFSPYSDYVQR